MRRVQAILLMLIVPAILVMPMSAEDGDTILAFKDVRVFNGVNIIPRCTVIVSGQVIQAVGPDVSIPTGAEIIEGQDLTLLPGLIDSHVHALSHIDLRKAIIFGVTTEFDMCTSIEFMQQTRSKQKSGVTSDMSDLFSAGIIITAPKGHGTEHGIDVPTIESPEEADAFVQARLDEGCDYIKLTYDTLGFRPSPSVETITALIKAAHERNLLTVVHISQAGAAQEMAKAGVDGLAHVFADTSPDDELINLIKEKNVFVIPTLSVMNNIEHAKRTTLLDDPRMQPWLSPENTAALRPSDKVQSVGLFDYDFARDAVRRLNKAGVPILAGTDSPNPGTVQGVSLHNELELLVDAGLTPVQALASATSVPADVFRLTDRGRIAPGLRADLVLVKGNPAEDITATRGIMRVWKQGQAIDREDYKNRLAKRLKYHESTGLTPPPDGSETGLISDFDTDDFSARFGYFWFASSDYMQKGNSSAIITLHDGGANGSKGALEISCTIKPGSMFPWAGAFFYPGDYLIPVNLSEWDGIRLMARGEGKDYVVMLMLKGQKIPAMKVVHIGQEWTAITLPFNDFNNSDGSNIMGIIIGAGPAPGTYTLLVDDVGMFKDDSTS